MTFKRILTLGFLALAVLVLFTPGAAEAAGVSAQHHGHFFDLLARLFGGGAVMGLTVGTGAQPWQLKAGSDVQPTLTPGRPTTFFYNDVPTRAPGAPCAYYLEDSRFTIKGTIANGSGGTITVPRDLLPWLLIDSINLGNTWMGTPVSSDYVLGGHLRIIEFIAGGFKYGERKGNRISIGTESSVLFSLTLAIPAGNDKRGGLDRDTSQLALLYKTGALRINMAAASVADTFAAGLSFTGLTGKVSTKLVPRQEIVLGTAMEFVLHQPTVGGRSILIDGFGRNTKLTGVQQKGGVAYLAALSNAAGQGGTFSVANVTRVDFQWRGLQQTDDIDGYLNMFGDYLPNDRVQATPNTNAGTTTAVNDFQDYPYPQDNVDGEADNLTLANRLAFEFVLGGDAVRLTDLQTAETDEVINLDVTGGFSGQAHQILAEYARVWEDAKRAAFVALVTKGGAGSLAAYVLGKDEYLSADLKPRFPTDKHVITPDQGTYLPWQFV